MIEKKVLPKKLIDYFLSKNILLSEEVLEELLEKPSNEQIIRAEELKNEDLLVLTSKKLQRIREKETETNSVSEEHTDHIKVISQEPNRPNREETETNTEEGSEGIEVLFSYKEKPKKRTVKDFVDHFRARYKQMEIFFRNNPRIGGLTSINKLRNKQPGDKVSIIAMINDIQITRNENIIVDVEDLTGQTKILISKNSSFNDDRRSDTYQKAKELVHDDMIAINGSLSKDIIFANELFFADIPLTKELKKGPREEYAIFLGDPHVGAKVFLKESFENFLSWVNKEKNMTEYYYDSEYQKISVTKDQEQNIINKIKYLIITGDLIEGVGIYPNQESDLEIKDVYKQYEELTNYLKKIPSHIQIIISAGNHDAMRIAEPQPTILRSFAEELYEMKNAHILSNPASINLSKTKEFEGFNFLLYHGYSFPYYADNIENIRTNGAMERADLIMKALLTKRHLAPSHGSTLYIPDADKDHLVIEEPPDFFVTGHIHRLTTVENHKSITLLNCSTWVGQTDYQEKVGLKPQIAKLPIVDLKTRRVRVLDFEI